MTLRVNGPWRQLVQSCHGDLPRPFFVKYSTIDDVEALPERGKELWGVKHDDEELERTLKGLDTYYQSPPQGATRRVGLEIDESSLRFGEQGEYFKQVSNYLHYLDVTPVPLDDVKLSLRGEAIVTARGILSVHKRERSSLIRTLEIIAGNVEFVKKYDHLFAMVDDPLGYVGNDLKLFSKWLLAKEKRTVAVKALAVVNEHSLNKREIIKAWQENIKQREEAMMGRMDRDNLDIVIIGDAHAERLSKEYRDRTYVSFCNW